MRTDFAPAADSLPLGCHCSCVISVWPEPPETSDTCFIPAVPVAEKTAYTVVWVVVVEPCTGLFAEDDPVDGVDPSGNDDVLDPVETLSLPGFGRFGGIRFSGIPYINTSSRNTSARWGALDVGFLGYEPWGWIDTLHGGGQWDQGNPGMRQIANEVGAPIFPSDDIGQAYNYILSCFQTGSGGTQAGEPIRIFGYSWGGISAVKLARWVGRSALLKNSEIDLYTLDPVSKGRFPPTSVASSVTYYWNRYETGGDDTKLFGQWVHGEPVSSNAKNGDGDEVNVNPWDATGDGHEGIVYDPEVKNDLIKKLKSGP